jgi:hypothetical protein
MVTVLEISLTPRLTMVDCHLIDPSIYYLSTNLVMTILPAFCFICMHLRVVAGMHKKQVFTTSYCYMNEFRSFVGGKTNILGVDCRAISNADETIIHDYLEGK